MKNTPGPKLLICLVFLALSAPLLKAKESTIKPSKLWGKKGELWKANGRLPDFSYAGYHRGEKKLPKNKATKNVKDFGAKGDGKKDDTEAFKKAIKAAAGHVLLIPAGRYKITEQLHLNKSNTVLRGEGPSKTTLFFPKSLTDIKPNWGQTSGGIPTSNYSWSGGLIRIAGSYRSKTLTGISKQHKRGATTLAVTSTKKLSKKMRIRIGIKDDANHSLVNYLYQGQPGNISNIKNSRDDFICHIRSISRNSITIDRPLPFDLRPEWKPTIYSFNPSVTEVGVENLCMAFPKGEYKGHFSEVGFNAFSLNSVSDCWLRNIVIKNAESGFFARGYFCTFKNITLASDTKADRHQTVGHHGILISGHSNLLTGFEFKNKYIHDITIASSRNVASNGKGVDISFDHHKKAPHANLFTQIDIGQGTRMFKSGGGDKLGRHAGAWITFWNIRSQKNISWPHKDFAPDIFNMVGISSTDKQVINSHGKWFEPIAAKTLFPQNLYEAQLKKRLQK